MKFFYVLIILIFLGCTHSDSAQELRNAIQTNTAFPFVKEKALEIIKTGFNAGDGYSEVWIRDYNTFIELSAEVFEYEKLEENLLVFFRLQGVDGNIVDGFIPQARAKEEEGGYTYIYSDLEPVYCGHKNTVETDHETSLVQAVYKLIRASGNNEILFEKIGELTVADRMEFAVEFLLKKRWSDKYGLVYGATTADWGDVQHSDSWGVTIDENTKFCVDIYDNAMFVIALNNMIEMLPDRKMKWLPLRDSVAKNIMEFLWDEKNQKFIPHLYLEESPFPVDFDENKIFYHGGTAVAIEAGLLDTQQIKLSLDKMRQNVKSSGAASIGLTLYPPYPDWAFENKGMYPYGYQNGGDWTWFGGRMIQQLIRYGFVQEAYDELQSMVKRVRENDGFFEWYTKDNEPKGSGTFRGSAGVLYKAIGMLEDWANHED